MTVKAQPDGYHSITAYLMKQLGPTLVVDYAKRLGINSPLDPVPSLCLGAGDVSVYELVGAYSTFMNKGVWTAPLFITHIEDKNGRVLETFMPQTHSLPQSASRRPVPRFTTSKLLIGLGFLAVVFFSPDGVLGLWERWRARRARLRDPLTGGAE